MRQGFLEGSRYSPGNMRQEALEALFVGREDHMRDVISRLVSSIQERQKHYLLLVGPRGSGKTHFLTLAYHRLMNQLSENYSRESVIIAFLNEEEWGVASYLDFIVRILRTISNQVPKLSDSIDEVYSKFSANPQHAESFSLKLLREHTQDKTLLLFCENLIDLFQGLGEVGQKKLRTTIQEEGNWAILASTPSLFSAIQLQENPFYGFFTIRTLEKIGFQTGIDLLVKKAIHEGKQELAEFLRTPHGRARARAIHHLAAGNHRAYVVLFDFLDKESLDDLVGPFMHMIDDLTPYYQDRMRQLPPAQRKIVEYLCLEGTPTTIKDIATPCLMSHQTAAKQIGELENSGFVNKIRSGRHTYCELSEPLMRICIEVKDNNTQHIRLFIDFLRHWFTTRELKRRQDEFHHNGSAGKLDRVHVQEAVTRALKDHQEPFIDALQIEAEHCLDADDYSGLAAIQEILVKENGNAEDYRLLTFALVESGKARDAIAIGREALKQFPVDADIYFNISCAYLMLNKAKKAFEAINKAIDIEGNSSIYLCIRADIQILLGQYQEAIKDAKQVLKLDKNHWHSLSQMIRSFLKMNEIEDAEKCVKEIMSMAPKEPNALFEASSFYYNQDQYDQSLGLIERAIKIDPDRADLRQLRGLIYFMTEDYAGAVEDLRYYASKFPNSVSTFCRLSDSLILVGKYEEAIDVARHLLEIDPQHTHANFVLGRSLLALGRQKEAISEFNELLISNDYHSLLGASKLVARSDDYRSAHKYLDRAQNLEPQNRRILIERVNLYINESKLDLALDCAKNVKELPDEIFLGQLLEALISAMTKPLHLVVEELLAGLELRYIANIDYEHVATISRVLSVSVRQFGPRYISPAFEKLQNLLVLPHDDGVVIEIVSNFILENVDKGFPGTIDEWEAAFESLSQQLGKYPNLSIAFEILKVAVRFTNTGDRGYLLRLPLEQRELIEEILSLQTLDRDN